MSTKSDEDHLTLASALCGVEMGLALAGVPVRGSGVSAALDFLKGAAISPAPKAIETVRT